MDITEYLKVFPNTPEAIHGAYNRGYITEETRNALLKNLNKENENE